MGWVVELAEIDRTQTASVGGKAANLGELRRVDGIRVPDGFCVTTEAYRRIVGAAPALVDLLDRLPSSAPDDAIGEPSARIRDVIERAVLPDELMDAIDRQLERLGPTGPFAVRSSATAEDLPDTSFAGQQDSYLNIAGRAEVARHIRSCWASLFTERAVAYRVRHGVDHRSVDMGVVVQRMAPADASGVLFTADPLSGNRTITAVEVVGGLGESLVSGRANPDTFRVRDNAIVHRTVAVKPWATHARSTGGTEDRAVDRSEHRPAVLTDSQVLRLARLGRQIEAHFGGPQDIEWCLVDNTFEFVQSRPITTLFPVPDVDDGRNHVYLSVGHQQMMTAPLRPLGLDLRQLTTRAPMVVAGGRQFVDVTDTLASPIRRAGILDMLVRSEPLMGNALMTVLARPGFLPAESDEAVTTPADAESDGRTGAPSGPDPIDNDPAIPADLIDHSQASIATLRRDIAAKSGPDLIDFIRADIPEMQRILFDPRSFQAIMASNDATWWLNDHLESWLGEKNAADVLTLSVPNNITSDMGLELLDIADLARPYPGVVTFLERVAAENPDGDEFLDELSAFDGGREVSDALRAYLDRYGMRCDGEIDITRPRWSEHPAALVPALVSNVKNFQEGARQRRSAQGRARASAWEHDLLRRVSALPDGEERAEETKYMIDRVRIFAGYREYPKYAMMSRYFVYKQALMGEARRLLQARVLRAQDDVFYLTLEEVGQVVRSRRVDHELIRHRRSTYAHDLTLTPPRVLTSDGEAITGSYSDADLPAGALAGLAVSAGMVEGRARVVTDMAKADLEPGDILVTTYTDPGWTPLFAAAAGLVTEVGGLMTHGAVIAREYGLPAVVGVEGATRLIQDGQLIRLHGSDGYVEILT